MAGATIVLIPLRVELNQAHVVLTYLLIVLGASASGGRALGLSLACVGFLLIDYYFQPPFDTITVDKGLDWIVLLAFLATALVATQLLARAQAQRQLAEERAKEIDRFASLGAETLNVGRAEEALTAIAAVIRDAVSVARCEIHLDDRSLPVRQHDGEGQLAVATSYAAGEIANVDSSFLREISLTVRGLPVGHLRLRHSAPIVLSAAQERSLGALAYYAALAVERARLAADAEHAAVLRESDKLKDALLAAVSHDLRTPLTAIKALAHEASIGGDERAALIEAQADRLNRFVADLLDLSRLNGGVLPVSSEIEAAEDLVGSAISEASHVLDARRIVPIIARDEPVLLGRFDFTQSLRVLVNLLENAGKYAPADTPIAVRIEREVGAIAFSVEDRGSEIPEADRERIFDAFYRAPTVASHVGGAGLGLAIARRLAVAQGGSLVYAPRDGGGNVFTLRLPAAGDDVGVL